MPGVPTAAVNGLELYYELGGDGPRLLFFNGSGATLETSAPLIDLLRRDFEVLGHDQRGLGRTSVPAEPFTMADYAADGRALLDHVGWERTAVIGVSFGGMVAQELAVTFPDRVSRLALLCTSSGGAGGSSYPLHELATLPADERNRQASRLADIRLDPAWQAEHPGEWTPAPGPARVEPTSSEARRGQRAQLEARRHHDVFDRLPRITAPTLVAGGRFDGIAPPDNSAAIAARIPGAELRMYDGGHLFFAQDPAALPDVLRFLAD